jgi:hypothetical protein
MKTSEQSRIFLAIIYKFQPLLLCENLYLLLLSLLASCWLWALSLPISQKIQGHLAHLAIRNTLTVSFNELFRSKRFCVGIVLIIVGLLSKNLYLAFDPDALFDKWIYYKNTYWYLWTIRSQMKDILFSVGVLLLFPTKIKLRYIVLLNMFGATMEIIHYSFYTVDYETFHMPFNWTVKLVGFFLPIFLLVIADYMCYRKYHLHDGSVKRIVGIVETPNLDADRKIEIVNSEKRVIENLYAKY